MNNEEYKKYIMEMLTKIDDNQHLKRIFNYTHKYFLESYGDRKNSHHQVEEWMYRKNEDTTKAPGAATPRG